MYKSKQNLFNNSKDTSILYELALERGKNRGWYPSDWVLKDYEKHLFKTKKNGA